MEMTEEEKEASEILTSFKQNDTKTAIDSQLVYQENILINFDESQKEPVTYVVVPSNVTIHNLCEPTAVDSDSSIDVEGEDEEIEQLEPEPGPSWNVDVRTSTRKNNKKAVRQRRRLTEKVDSGVKRVKLNELTKLEDNAEQVAARLEMGCDCANKCFETLDPNEVYKHRLNIADLTKAEHSMYLMGVLLASMQIPESGSKKERIRSTYNYQGRKVCLTAFLYLEHVTLYQVKRLKKHLMYHGVSPRIHGNQGRKPANTLPLDIYQHAADFIKGFIEKHHVKAKSMPGSNNYHLPAECTKKTLHDEYKIFCGQTVKPMQYSTFTTFIKKQFPNVKFQKMERSVDRFESRRSKTKINYDGCDGIAVRDVNDLLQAQYAIITGGKSGNGCPIITFPDTGNFSSFADAEYERLMLYLTSVPSMQEADLGFVLVIDRRTDHWNSVKPTLLKISGYFPAIVHTAYVLRPTGIIKKTISDVLNKIFKEDFKFKVVVCNSLEELHSYIDKSQLTSDLGGTLQYDHNQWIQERELLESLTETMQNVSNFLDEHTSSVEQVPLPDDLSGLEKLVLTEEDEYQNLKELIGDAAKQGEDLLETFRKGPLTSSSSDFGNVAAVERLLVQLEETERTFTSFHEDRMSLIKVHRDYRRFLKESEELKVLLQQHLDAMSNMVEMGDTAERVEVLFKETNDFQAKALVDLERTDEVLANGQLLLKKRSSFVDTLQTNCDTLKRLNIILTERIEHRIACLTKHRELQEHIDAANMWCSRGVELLSTLRVEKCNGSTEQANRTIEEIKEFLVESSDLELNGQDDKFKDIITPETKALVTQVVQRIGDVKSMCETRLNSLQALAIKPQRPVQTVTPEPGVPLQPTHGAPVRPKVFRKASTMAKLEVLTIPMPKKVVVDEEIPTQDPQILFSKRDHILAELLETERVYCNELWSIIQGYVKEMDSPEMQPLIPSQLVGNSSILFGNIPELYEFHNNIFLRDLQNCISNTELVALCFTHRKSELYKLYSAYCQNTPQSEQLRSVIGERNIFFRACQIKLGHKLPLAAYLLKPIQRITKYQLILKDLLRNSEDTICRSQLHEALESMLVVLKCVNDGMHQISITGFRGNLSEHGELLMQGSFSVWTESKKIRELRLMPMQRHLFLYRKAILFCKKEIKENAKEVYHFKRCLHMSQIGLTEKAKGDDRKFEIWLQGRQEVYTIQAATIEQKQAWVQQIKQLLLEQLAELRGASIKQHHMRKVSLLHRPLGQAASWETQHSIEVAAGNSNRAFSCDESSPSISRGKSMFDLPEYGEDSSDADPDSDEDDTFVDDIANVEGGKFVISADYRAASHNEISLKEGGVVEVLKKGCGGWWYVKLIGLSHQGQPIEGWAPSAYLETCRRKNVVPENS